MPQTGKIHFFTEAEIPSPEVTCKRILEISGATKPFGAFLDYREDQSWANYQRWYSGIDDELEEDEDREFLERGKSIDELLNLYEPGRRLFVSFGKTPMGDRIYEAVIEGIGEEVRGWFAPGELSVELGYHDIFEDVENEEGTLFGRAFLSIGFFGYSTPKNWKQFRREIFNLKKVMDIKKEYEGILGPLKQCVYWSV